jgi:hypothetical protein
MLLVCGEGCACTSRTITLMFAKKGIIGINELWETMYHDYYYISLFHKIAKELIILAHMREWQQARS